MSDTVRERIIQGVLAALADIRTAKGYQTEMGANVQRALFATDKMTLPAVFVFPLTEQKDARYDSGKREMSISVQGIEVFGDTNPSVVSEQLLGDIIECMTATTWTLGFTSGQTEVEAGDTITGQTTSATGYIESVTTSAGTWAGGDAAGHLVIRRVVGDFETAETVQNDAASAVAVIASISGETPEDRVTGGLASLIDYTEGGVDDYPRAGETVTGAMAVFSVHYTTNKGNPYS